MEIIPFIKNLFIDSLSGISFQNLPFIILQLCLATLSVLVCIRLLGLKDNKKNLLLWSIGFTMLFIIASTSVPLAILGGFIILVFAMLNKGLSLDAKLLLFLFSFAAGSGHLILLLLAFLLMFIFSVIKKKGENV